MYIVPPLWPHILWLYWGRNDSELVLWPVEWRLISGRASESSLSAWRNLRSLPTHREITRSFSAKCRGVSPRIFSAKLRGENPRRNNWFLFFSAKKKIISRKGCSAAKCEKSVDCLPCECEIWHACQHYIRVMNLSLYFILASWAASGLFLNLK